MYIILLFVLKYALKQNVIRYKTFLCQLKLFSVVKQFSDIGFSSFFLMINFYSANKIFSRTIDFNYSFVGNK